MVWTGLKSLADRLSARVNAALFFPRFWGLLNFGCLNSDRSFVLHKKISIDLLMPNSCNTWFNGSMFTKILRYLCSSEIEARKQKHPFYCAAHMFHECRAEPTCSEISVARFHSNARPCAFWSLLRLLNELPFISVNYRLVSCKRTSERDAELAVHIRSDLSDWKEVHNQPDQRTKKRTLVMLRGTFLQQFSPNKKKRKATPKNCPKATPTAYHCACPEQVPGGSVTTKKVPGKKSE